MRRNPSLLIRRILWLWHFEHTMSILSIKSKDKASLAHYISYRHLVSAKNIYASTAFALKELDGNRPSKKRVP